MFAMTIEQAWQIAVAHHRAGQFAEAEALYRQILGVQPRHADALHLRGLVAHQTGRHDVAIGFIQQAISLVPGRWDYHSNLGAALLAASRLEEAIAAQRTAVQLQPESAQAHFNLGGALRHRAEFFEEAITAYRRALELDPAYAETEMALGGLLRSRGDLAGGLAAYQRALRIKPDLVEAQIYLGNAFRDLGQMNDAIAACRRAVELNPRSAEAYSNLGVILQESGRSEEAVAACRRAIELKPDFAAAHSNLGEALVGMGCFDEAIVCYRQALAWQPAHAEILTNLGAALHAAGRLGEAISVCREAIALRPGFARAQENLAAVLLDEWQLDDALTHARRALELQPHFAEAHSTLAGILLDQGRADEAVTAARRAIELKPALPEARVTLARALLMQGQLAEGWEEYEWRWRLKHFAPFRRIFREPEWDGTPLAGQRILLHAEQGLGDTLQFIRYAPLVQARGGEVIVECQREFTRLFRANLPGVMIVGRGEPLPAFDTHCLLMSLPRLSGTTSLDQVPATVPYLRSDPQAVDRWRQRLAAVDPQRAAREAGPLRIGLVWAGGIRFGQTVANRIDERRSLRLEQLAPLAQVCRAVFVSLQKGEPAAQAAHPPLGMNLVDWTAELNDFADTAALIEALDLVVSVDTAVAHLAGAMGKPVWLLNRFDTDWRWLREREDSPWYPTMRLVRQSTPGDWKPVIRRTVAALHEFATRWT